MTDEQLYAPYESPRDAGSTPATSTILPSVYGVSGAIAKLLPDYCPIIAHILMGVLNAPELSS